jgi:3-oxoacyl-[acyl-carrier-protein] synthase III
LRVLGVGLVTGWGEGVRALPADARAAAAGRRLLPIPSPAAVPERLRRASRECVLAVRATRAALEEAGLAATTVAGERTGLLYVTAGAYGAANRAFVEADGGPPAALGFPYTAPSAVPAEVAIEFGLTGPYAILVGGARAGVEALGQAEQLLARGLADRVLVLAVETFAECWELYARAVRGLGGPLVEAAACAIVEPGAPRVRVVPATAAGDLERLARRRAGETLSCEPLIGLALARPGDLRVTGAWRGRRAGLAVE